MIITKTGATIAFTPQWLRDNPDPPVFHLRVGALSERDLFEATLDGEYDAAPVYDFILRAAALAGTVALGGDDAAALTDLVSADFGDDGEISPVDRATLDGLYEILLDHWPDYRSLRKQAARRQKLMPTLAFVTWCTGWENVTDSRGVSVEFAVGATGKPSDECLRRIPDLMLAIAGSEALAMQYGRGEEKNSAPPSPSAATGESSSSDSGPVTAG